MKFRNMVAITAGAVLALSAPALAQTVAAAGLKVGSVVYSPDGSEVGKVERIDGEMVTLNTGTHSATLGSASFSKGPKGPAIGVTKQKLNETIETAQSQDKAKLDAALVAGATVRSSDCASSALPTNTASPATSPAERRTSRRQPRCATRARAASVCEAASVRKQISFFVDSSHKRRLRRRRLPRSVSRFTPWKSGSERWQRSRL